MSRKRQLMGVCVAQQASLIACDGPGCSSSRERWQEKVQLNFWFGWLSANTCLRASSIE